jgi:hypothetical protein
MPYATIRHAALDPFAASWIRLIGDPEPAERECRSRLNEIGSRRRMKTGPAPERQAGPFAWLDLMAGRRPRRQKFRKLKYAFAAMS